MTDTTAKTDLVTKLCDAHVEMLTAAVELVEVWEHPRTTKNQAIAAEDALIAAVKRWKKASGYTGRPPR